MGLMGFAALYPSYILLLLQAEMTRATAGVSRKRKR